MYDKSESWFDSINRGSEFFFGFPLLLIVLYLFNSKIGEIRRNGYSFSGDLKMLYYMSSYKKRGWALSPKDRNEQRGEGLIACLIIIAVALLFCYNGLQDLGWWQKFWGGLGM